MPGDPVNSGSNHLTRLLDALQVLEEEIAADRPNSVEGLLLVRTLDRHLEDPTPHVAMDPPARLFRLRSRTRSAVAAALVLITVTVWVFTSRDETVGLRQLEATVFRSRGTDPEIRVTLALSEMGYVRVLIVDRRHEVWLQSLGKEERVESLRLESHELLRVTFPYHPETRERGIGLLIVVSRGPSPTGDELIEAIPETALVSENASRSELIRGLDALTATITQRFDCTVQVQFLE